MNKLKESIEKRYFGLSLELQRFRKLEPSDLALVAGGLATVASGIYMEASERWSTPEGIVVALGGSVLAAVGAYSAYLDLPRNPFRRTLKQIRNAPETKEPEIPSAIAE